MKNCLFDLLNEGKSCCVRVKLRQIIKSIRNKAGCCVFATASDFDKPLDYINGIAGRSLYRSSFVPPHVQALWWLTASILAWSGAVAPVI